MNSTRLGAAAGKNVAAVFVSRQLAIVAALQLACLAAATHGES